MTLTLNYNKKVVPFLGIFIILVMGYFGGWWDDFFIQRPAANTLKPAVPSIDMLQTKLTGWDKGKKTWEIEAQRIWQSADGNSVYFQKITHGVAFSAKNKRVDFKAGWARWERIHELLYLGGGLEAKVDNGTLETEDGVLNYRTEELNSNTGVYMTQKDSWATAKTLQVNFSKEEIELEGDVVLIQKKDQMVADGVIFNQKDETYQMIGPKEATINP
jgi:LPS export ABC transporter protein LptC